jgi:hypothetical protein
MRREHCIPLYTSASIYHRVKDLVVDDPFHHEIYAGDYASGVIPEWRVAEREVHSMLIILTLIDPKTEQPGLAGQKTYVAHDIFFQPTKVLAGQYYLYFPGCIHARNALCDVRQEARKIAEQLMGKKRESLVAIEQETNRQVVQALLW